MTPAIAGKWIAGLLVAASAAAWAQSTVYESQGKSGPVFSDKPMPGATPVDLPPPNVISMPRPTPVAPPAPASAPAYRSLVFVSPAQGATIHSNTGAFDVSVRTTPALRSGDRIRVMLDGSSLPANFRSANLHVSEDDWSRAARSDNVEHTLQVVVVDSQGKALISSDAISFYVQRATVGGKRR